MRVIGGEFRSRVLKSVPGLDVRPTPDRLREALFNVLAPRIEGATFADLYAGTGSVGNLRIGTARPGPGKGLPFERGKDLQPVQGSGCSAESWTLTSTLKMLA